MTTAQPSSREDITVPDTPTDEPRPFGTFLLEHAKGRSHEELSARLRELVEAVLATGKRGTLAYKITIKPTQQDGTVEIDDDIKLTAPAGRPSSIFYATDTFDLVRADPRQLNIDDLERETR